MRYVIATPLLLLLALFALSNKDIVKLGLWPTDWSVQAPLSLVVLVAMAAAFFVGALMLWISGLGARQRMRRAEYRARLLDEQVRDLQARLLATMPATPAVPAMSVPMGSVPMGSVPMGPVPAAIVSPPA